jgi:dTDP-4-dehydro-6-deoxy-alpha-D-glucopyranose 2,3-dehydratase
MRGEEVAMTSTAPAVLLFRSDELTPIRIARSVLSRTGSRTDLAGFHRWFADFRHQAEMRVDRVELDSVAGWRSDPQTGDIGHDSGGFFTVEGIDVRIPDGPVPRWSQPIINQPEVGILGILVKELDGVLHCLMQAKVEPGNPSGLQLAPTVQATRSNYTRVHQGRPVPYLGYFRDSSRYRVITDVRQSEQGSWFRQKRNRNMVVEVFDEVPVRPGFCWLTLGQVHRLLAIDDLVNMDARTVLSCLPFAGSDLLTAFAASGDGFSTALIRSCSVDEGSLHTTAELLNWITELRTRTDIRTRQVPLNAVPHWSRSKEKISHDSGLFFDVIGVDVHAQGREVSHWMQPMLRPCGTGLAAFLVTRVAGVVHVLVNARVEPGYIDIVELAPTVQCIPDNYRYLPAAARPLFLDRMLRARPDQIRFEATLAEEGGRFYHARNRYLVVETDATVPEHPEYRWVALHQLVDLLRHSYYVNVQARSLIACLHSLSTDSLSTDSLSADSLSTDSLSTDPC